MCGCTLKKKRKNASNFTNTAQNNTRLFWVATIVLFLTPCEESSPCSAYLAISHSEQLVMSMTLYLINL